MILVIILAFWSAFWKLPAGRKGGLALRWVDVKELKSSYHDLERSQHHSVSVLEQPSRYAKKEGSPRPTPSIPLDNPYSSPLYNPL